MIGRGLALTLLAAASPLPAAAVQPAAEAPFPSIERFYQDAMACKVRVEALNAIASRGQKKIAKALAYWTEQERIAGAKLGKDGPEIMKDEIFAGLAEVGGSPGLERAQRCVQAASIGRSLRNRGTPF